MKPCAFALAMLAALPALAAEPFEPIDVFSLQYATDPELSPDGKAVAYVRTVMDIKSDRSLGNLWLAATDGKSDRPLTSGPHNARSPVWSPDGKKLLYIANDDGSNQLYLRWMDSGQTARLTNLTQSPGNISFSPDGKWIAFTMAVPNTPAPFAKMPAMPKGAHWAEPAKVIDKVYYRADGAGYLDDSITQLFVMGADGGAVRQLTKDPFNHGGSYSWDADSRSLVLSANRHQDWQFQPINTELYRVGLNGDITALTDRNGPDNNPRVSPNGKRIAYTGFDDKKLGYQNSALYLMNKDGSGKKVLATGLDRAIKDAFWDKSGDGLFVSFDDKGHTKLAYVSLAGKVTTLTDDMGGTELGRPYDSGSFSVAGNTLAYTRTSTSRPADVAVLTKGGKVRQLTHLNDDLFAFKQLGKVQEYWVRSKVDELPIQTWRVLPPDFDPAKQYPLLLEIHGGPFADYGARFAAEMQLYANAGYIVVYANPRGSTSYGEAFANRIHHNYPSHDYDDLMSVVDDAIAKGNVDTRNLFVTGGSGGGVLTAWIVGSTDRFRAAVVAKPVINWLSFTLTADFSPYFSQYWFAKKPWEDPMGYWQRSPLSKVGNVKTPTMLLTGESDYRTPISETEQFYQALKLQKVDTAMVRIPGAGHGLTARPSNLMRKVVFVLSWFDKHKAN
ncbi:MAG: S9 family peptidase [Pseudomonadota bacterium]|uniref:S9 family peptidase n=1 Tax=Gallaecimonas pentaromativorans TaxID=584787 RepID=UPI00067EBAF7|nr:S9 family peptidase [Gallaecimonas pentaromativorans]MED5525084.1 S9 family peptidase [Pseudomonadota bacterium]